MRPRGLTGLKRIIGSRRRSASHSGGAPCIATTRNTPRSYNNRLPNFAWQMRVAFSTMARNTGSRSPGELEITRNTSEVAVCCSRASASSRVRASSCCFNSVSELDPLLTRVLSFVPAERSLRPRVRLFAPLRDKVTPAAGRSTRGPGRRHLKHTTAGWMGHLRQCPDVTGAVKPSGALSSGGRPSVWWVERRGISEGRQAHLLARLQGYASSMFHRKEGR